MFCYCVSVSLSLMREGGPSSLNEFHRISQFKLNGEEVLIDMAWLLKSVIGTGLPFTIGDRLENYPATSGWEMYEGTRVVGKVTEEISVFKSVSTTEKTKNALKRLRTLRHPNILCFKDAVEERDTIYILTERVVPLRYWLKKLDNERAAITEPEGIGGGGVNDSSSDATATKTIKAARRGSIDDTSIPMEERRAIHDKRVSAFVAFGIFEVLGALQFVNLECKIAHCNLCPNSLFVDRAGSWRLGGFDLASEMNIDEDNYGLLGKFPEFLAARYQAPERETQRWGRGIPISAHDAWSLGCVIEELHHRVWPDSSNSGDHNHDCLGVDGLEAPTQQLQQLIAKLKEKIPKRRVDPKKALRAPFFRKNVFVSMMGALDNWTLKNPEERVEVFKSLTTTVQSFPSAACNYKILPILLEALRIGDSPSESWGSWALAPLMQIAPMISLEHFQKEVLPATTRLFSSNNRATRLQLLQSLPSFVDRLGKPLINDTIFSNVITGFRDTATIMKEWTIKSMVHFSPYLSSENLHRLLNILKTLLTSDREAPVRANCVLCFSYITKHISSEKRVPFMSHMYGPAIRDPYPACRSAALRGVLATCLEDLVSHEDVCRTLLPGICPCLADPDVEVREEAFKVLQRLQLWLLDWHEKGAISLQKNMEENSKKAAVQSISSPEISRDNSGGAQAAGKVGRWAAGAAAGVGNWALGAATKQIFGADDDDDDNNTSGPSSPSSKPKYIVDKEKRAAERERKREELRRKREDRKAKMKSKHDNVDEWNDGFQSDDGDEWNVDTTKSTKKASSRHRNKNKTIKKKSVLSFGDKKSRIAANQKKSFEDEFSNVLKEDANLRESLLTRKKNIKEERKKKNDFFATENWSSAKSTAKKKKDAENSSRGSGWSDDAMEIENPSGKKQFSKKDSGGNSGWSDDEIEIENSPGQEVSSKQVNQKKGRSKSGWGSNDNKDWLKSKSVSSSKEKGKKNLAKDLRKKKKDFKEDDFFSNW
eukprot:g3706.t1